MPTPNKIKVRSKSTGETFDVPWEGEGKPSSDYIKAYISGKTETDKLIGNLKSAMQSQPLEDSTDIKLPSGDPFKLRPEEDLNKPDAHEEEQKVIDRTANLPSPFAEPLRDLAIGAGMKIRKAISPIWDPNPSSPYGFDDPKRYVRENLGPVTGAAGSIVSSVVDNPELAVAVPPIAKAFPLAGRALAGLFGIEAGRHAISQVPEIVDKIKEEGLSTEVGSKLGELLTSGVFAAAGAKHAIKPSVTLPVKIPKPKTPKARPDWLPKLKVIKPEDRMKPRFETESTASELVDIDGVTVRKPKVGFEELLQEELVKDAKITPEAYKLTPEEALINEAPLNIREQVRNLKSELATLSQNKTMDSSVRAKEIGELVKHISDVEKAKKISLEKPKLEEPKLMVEQPATLPVALTDPSNIQMPPQPPPKQPNARMKNPKPNLPEIPYEEWTDFRRATEYESKLTESKFDDLRPGGFQSVLDYNRDPASIPRGAEVKQFFDDWSQRLADVGVGKVNKTTGKIEPFSKENYLPQLWEQDPTTVKTIYKRLGLRPSFTMESVFQNYQAGIDAGLTPKYKSIPELMGWYEGRARKLVADRMYWNHLKQQGKIVSSPSGMPPRGPQGNPNKYADWELLDPTHFPVVAPKVKYGKREVRQARNFFAPREEARAINNYLRQPETEGGLTGGLSKVAGVASKVKNVAMAAGIPGTGITGHGINVAINSALFSKNPLKQIPKTISYLFNPKKAERRLQQHKELIPFIMKTGTTLGVEDHSFLFNVARRSWKERKADIKANTKPGLQRFGRTQYERFQHFFDEPLFQQVIPGIKTDHWIEVYKELRKQGLPEFQAGKTASKTVNNVFGGQNYNAMRRDKNLQNLLRASFLAPDWYESQARAVGNMGRSVASSDPRMQAYKWGVRNLIAFYVGANAVNYMTSGKLMAQNPSGSEFDVYAGQDAEGQERYVKLFNTSLPLIRIPFIMAKAVFAPDERGPNLGVGSKEIRNRLSLLVRPLVNLTMNTDYKGDPIFGEDSYGRPQSVGKQVAGAASEFAGVGPQQLKAFIDYMRGASGMEESAAQAFEAPLKYRRKGSSRRAGRQPLR